MYSGIILIDKQKGWTSHDVVAKLRGITSIKKIGHTGTLDPDATGLLPVCIGRATKLSDIISGKEKTYDVEFVLGYETNTEDISGDIIKKSDYFPKEDEIYSCIASFLGEYDQLPPMYSAIKINGKKLYEIARTGNEVERKRRRVNIINIQNIVINNNNTISMRVFCSKGTYIRSLCRDIGRKLGCYASMSNLRRISVGKFHVENAVDVLTLTKEKVEEEIVSTSEILSDYPKIYTSKEMDKLIENGNPIPIKFLSQEVEQGINYILFDAKKRLVGIFYKKGDKIFPQIMLME